MPRRSVAGDDDPSGFLHRRLLVVERNEAARVDHFALMPVFLRVAGCSARGTAYDGQDRGCPCLRFTSGSPSGSSILPECRFLVNRFAHVVDTLAFEENHRTGACRAAFIKPLASCRVNRTPPFRPGMWAANDVQFSVARRHFEPTDTLERRVTSW